MKSTIQRALLAVAVATLGAGAVGTAAAQAPAAGSGPDSGQSQDWHGGHHHWSHGGHRMRHHGHHGWRHGGHEGWAHGGPQRSGFGATPFAATLLRGTRQLNLTEQQHAAIRTIIEDSRKAHEAAAQAQRPDPAVLGDPGNAGYAAAVRNAVAAATARINEQSALAGKIYNVLNSDQKKQLPGVLASLKTEDHGRGGPFGGRRDGGGGAG
jgi:LTXXQ motif family protein